MVVGKTAKSLVEGGGVRVVGGNKPGRGMKNPNFNFSWENLYNVNARYRTYNSCTETKTSTGNMQAKIKSKN